MTAAKELVSRYGDQLWRTSVDRAQDRRPQMGWIDRYDDRPLYWTHLAATSALHQWNPDFEVTSEDRTELVQTFRNHARGVTDTNFPDGKRVTRVLVSGFDPYQLQNEPRRSNPSGVAALQLDERTFVTDEGVVAVEAVMLPVTWRGFDRGIVEDAFGPHLAADSSGRADLIMTISQGGSFDIEQWAGSWRGGAADNNNEGEPEPIPPVSDWPMPDEPLEFIETTLPYKAMLAADTGPFPAELDRSLCEWPPGTFPERGAITCHEGPPTKGSRAYAGGGGNYLSNESMYRSNRVRIGLGATDVPGGHLHTEPQTYPDDPAVLINEEFKNRRHAIADQTVALMKAAGRAVQ